jgi:protein O-GlcNAc transferase
VDAASVNEAVQAARRHYHAGDLDRAEQLCRGVLKLCPDHPGALYRLGEINRRAGVPGLAIAFLSRALALDPSVPSFHRAFGEALSAAGRTDEAEASLRYALALAPDDSSVYASLAGLLTQQSRLAEALDLLQQALAIAPEETRLHSSLAVVLLYMGQAAEAVACFRRASELAPDQEGPHAGILFAQHYLPGVRHKALLHNARVWAARHADPLTSQVPPHNNDPVLNRRLRVGYVSPDFQEHPVGRVLMGVLPAHNRDAVEIYCYSNRRLADGVAARLTQSAAHWRSLVHLTDDAAADLIRADQIDILVDLAGHTGGNRLLVLARKPAPIQALWLGYFDTTGMAAVDYVIADRHVCPPGDEPYYVEQIARLPHSFFSYLPADPSPAVAPLPALESGVVTFGCLNNLAKINARVIALWAQILHTVPESRLCLKYFGLDDPAVRERFTRLFAEAGVAPERLILYGRSSLVEHLGTYNQIDIGLDSFPYNGGMTTLDALWMGVPVISLSSDRLVGRMGRSVLCAAGLGHLVANSPAVYVAKAVALANDLSRLAPLRASLRDKLLHSPLCDGSAFARGLEALYREMWGAWCREQVGARS